MPELGPIIDGEIDRYRAERTPPFEAIAARRRRRLALRTGVAGVALVAVAAGAFALGPPPSTVEHLRPAAQPSPSPSPPPVRVIPSGKQAPTAVDEAAYALWQSKGSQNYTMKMVRMCFCPGGGEPMTVTVRDGAVARDAANKRGRAVEAKSIDELFQILLTGEADRYTVTYDPTYGFPRQLHLDYIFHAIDDEQDYEITDYRPT